jgi:hypothetical protein
VNLAAITVSHSAMSTDHWNQTGGAAWPEIPDATEPKTTPMFTPTQFPFETMSKRRRGFPSETAVKRGVRIVHGDKLLEEKLGRNDLCPCGSGRLFKRCCLDSGCFRRRQSPSLFSASERIDRKGDGVADVPHHSMLTRVS